MLLPLPTLMATASVLNEALSHKLVQRCCEEGQKVQFSCYSLEALGLGRVTCLVPPS